jgi:hypothetical protein
MTNLSIIADILPENIRKAMIESGKQKEPQMRSLNNSEQIKNRLFETIHKKYGISPAEILDGEQLNKFMNEPLTDTQRLAWYKMSGRYRNNLRVR